MTKLIYGTIISLDGYIEDASGGIQWGAPDEEVADFVNGLDRSVGTYLYGRRLYETMLFWETVDTTSETAAFQEFAAMWQAADKLVYSRTLGDVPSRRTRLECDFDPDDVRRLKATATTDVIVGGADLASQAIRAGLVDELQLYVVPVVMGRGKRALPADLHLDLDLIDVVRFASGFVHLRYGVRAVV